MERKGLVDRALDIILSGPAIERGLVTCSECAVVVER